MQVKRVLSFLLASLLIVNQSFAASMIGKVFEYNQNPKNPNVHPVFDGDRIKRGNRYMMRLNGATLVADSNTDLHVSEEHGVTVFKINEGVIRFRLKPEKIRISFRTPQGEVFSPEVVKASNNIIDGQITVKDNTIVELNEGNLQALTLNGITDIESGQGVILAQAEIAQSDLETTEVNTQTEQVEDKQITTKKKLVALRDKEIPDDIREILELIGEKGSAESLLNPKGEIDLANVETWDGNGELVDFNLFSLQEANLPVGTPVKVVCVRPEVEDKDGQGAEKEDSAESKGKNKWEALVRPLDSFYPEQFGEKSLIQLDVVAKSDLHPEGFVNLKFEESEGQSSEDVNDLSNRSTENWLALVVDEDLRFDEVTEEKRYILEGDDLKVVCLRSIFLVKPTYLVNQEHLQLVGRTVKTATELNPKGKVKIDGKIFDGGLVDYNLQVKKNVVTPKGTELVIIGVSGYDMTLLLQRPEEVLQETKFIGTVVEAKKKLDPFGNVVLGDKKWASSVVTDSLTPFYGVEIEPGQQLTVVGVTTQLLVVESDLLVPPLWRRGYELVQSNFTPIVTGITVVGPLVGIGLPLGLDAIGGGSSGGGGDDDDDDDDDDVASPIFP